MSWREEYKPLLWITSGFLFAFFLPTENILFKDALFSAFALLKWYAQEHVLLCLVPAFFIAGVIAIFVSQGAVIKYFGADAKKWVSYLIASVSGSILAVCSCTVLPLFSGIHKRGAGLGPAIAFLYSGPSINILAIILTARILGMELGIARVIGAVFFSVVIGLAMHIIYRNEEAERSAGQLSLPQPESGRPLWQTAFLFAVLVFLLIFTTWGKPDIPDGFFYQIFAIKWWLAGIFGLLLAVALVFVLHIRRWFVAGGVAIVAALALIFPEYPLISFTAGVIALSVIISVSPGEPEEWMQSSWDFAKQIMPLLGAGVLVAGFLLGDATGGSGIIPGEWISGLVGGNSIFANFFAAIVGAFMYFATLTEIPILQGLMQAGMGKGPALALLLAGPALSLPNMLVIRSVIGTQKTAVYVALVVVMATLSGLIYGSFFG